MLIQNRTQIGHRHPARAAREMATEPVSNRLRGFRGQPGEESSSRPRRTMAELLDTAWENRQLSYAKVRALTRIATTATEADLAEIAGPMTAAQCETIRSGATADIQTPRAREQSRAAVTSTSARTVR